jgi:Tfp pilus assembly protein PilV
MKRRGQRRERGYALAEAMVGGAVLLLAVSGLLTAISQANAHIARSVQEQRATQLLVERIERLRVVPTSNALWNAGSSDCTALMATPTGWTCTLVVSDVSDTAVGLSGVGPLVYKQAVFTMSSRGLSWSMETLKW